MLVTPPFARRSVNRNVPRVFNPDRKENHWGKRKLKRVVYVNTSKQIGDKDHIKVFANQDAAANAVRGEQSGRRCLRIRGSGVKHTVYAMLMCDSLAGARGDEKARQPAGLIANIAL